MTVQSERLRRGPRLDARFALQVHGPGDHLSRLVGRLRDPHRSRHAPTRLRPIGIRDIGTTPCWRTQDASLVLQSYWFIKSDHLGKVSVGKQSQASDNTAILVDGSGSLVPANWVLFDQLQLLPRDQTSGALRTVRLGEESGWLPPIGGGIGGDCNGVTQNVVRYDSPTFGGFSVSASWGEDDMWDVAARYAGELLASSSRLLLPTTSNAANYMRGRWTFQYFQVGAYLEHVPTGLFAIRRLRQRAV